MDKRKDIIKLLQNFKQNANQIARIDKMVFFGSRAKGTAKKRSDIDLLLVSSDFKKKKYFKRSPPFYLLWDYNYDVDILCLTPEELAKKQKEIGIIQQALKEGIEI